MHQNCLPCAAAAGCGLTPDGVLALVQELSDGQATALTQLPRNILARLTKSGLTPETVERCNAAAEALTVATEDPDDLPASWT